MADTPLNYKKDDNTTVGTMTDYQNSGSTYQSQLEQYRIDLEKARMSGLNTYADMLNAQLAQYAGQQRSDIQKSNMALGAAKARDMYAVQNQGAATDALQSYIDPYRKNIEEKYAEYMKESAQGIEAGYQKQATAFAKDIQEQAATFEQEMQDYLASIDTAQQEYASKQSRLLAKMFGIDMESTTWMDELVEDGYLVLNEDGSYTTTAEFDEFVARTLYGEDWEEFYDELVTSGNEEDKALVEWLVGDEGAMGRDVAGALGIMYDPSAGYGSESFEMIDPTTGQYASGAILNKAGVTTDWAKFTENHGGLSDSYVRKFTEGGKELYDLRTNRNNLRFSGEKSVGTPTTITYKDGTVVELTGDMINAGGNIKGKINKNYWEFVDRTQGSNYGKSMSLEDALENGTLKVGSIFEGKNGKQYIVVYFEKDSVGHSDVGVREVASITTK